MVFLDDLLQGGLIVHDPVAFDHLLGLGADEIQNKALGRLHTAVQIDGGQDGLHRVRQDGGALAAAADPLATSQQQAFAQSDLTGELIERAFADDGRP